MFTMTMLGLAALYCFYVSLITSNGFWSKVVFTAMPFAIGIACSLALFIELGFVVAPS